MSRIGIYRILCLINGKGYIGQSHNLEKREESHFYKLRKNKHHNRHLQRAFDKYGIDNFKFEILEECTLQELNAKEKYWMNFYDATSFDKGYNIRPDPTSNRGFKHTEEAKRKIAAWGTGRKHTEEEKARMREALKNRDQWGKNNPAYGKPPTEAQLAYRRKKKAFSERKKAAREIRICACGCEGTFEVIVTSSKIYLNHHQLIGKELKEHEVRTCLCGCGETFKVLSSCSQKYVDRSHYLKLNGVQRETRTCICGCGITFEVKVNSVKKFVSGHNSRNKVNA
jgi:group I intron endonuclease